MVAPLSRGQLAGDPDYRRDASSRFQFLKTALKDADVVRGVVRAVWPKVARAEADIACWLHRGLHAVSGNVRKSIRRRNTNNHAFLSRILAGIRTWPGTYSFFSRTLSPALSGARVRRLCSTPSLGTRPGPLVLREDTYRKARLIHRLTERYPCG